MRRSRPAPQIFHTNEWLGDNSVPFSNRNGTSVPADIALGHAPAPLVRAIRATPPHNRLGQTPAPRDGISARSMKKPMQQRVQAAFRAVDARVRQRRGLPAKRRRPLRHKRLSGMKVS